LISRWWGTSEVTKPLDGGVVIERLPNVIHLPPPVGPRWIRKKENARNWHILPRDVEKFAVGLSPNAMELSFDEYSWPFPYRPANHLFAAVRSDVFRKNAKAIVGWRTYEWSDWNIKRFGIFNDVAAKRNNVWLNELRRSHA
jgi:hypothetical protein